jgi:hypothetical protein
MYYCITVAPQVYEHCHLFVEFVSNVYSMIFALCVSDVVRGAIENFHFFFSF